MKTLLRATALAVAVILCWAWLSWKQLSSPVVITCGVASGGNTLTAKGVGVAEQIGTRIHQLATEPAPSAQDIKADIDGMFRKVLWYGIKAFLQSSRGEKIDPQIIRLQQQAAKAQQNAQLQCQPCPAGSSSDDGGNSNDPNLNVSTPLLATAKAGKSSKTGAALAADALRRAGFPEREIPMGVAVAKLESSFNPKAVNPAAGGNFGMWQINTVHADLLARYTWSDPYQNALMAYSVWKQAGGWSPWSTAATARAQAGTAPETGDSPQPVQPQQCSVSSDTPQIAQGDGQMVTANFAAYRNPRTVDQAIAYMERMAQTGAPISVGACLHYVGVAYGQQSTTPVGGHYWAKDQFYAAPAALQHRGDTYPPRGALLFWDTGPGRPGHIAIAEGDGRVASTDAPVRGKIGIVPFSHFSGYGKYLGWLPPYFVGKTNVEAA